MKEAPQISILMPAYNASKYIKEAIDSILKQTFTNFELIIINDGSGDNTKEIILSYTDNRIIYIENEKNIKLIKTLNKGIEYASGRYIARMDADDIALPQWLEIQYKFITSHDADVVSGHLLYLSESSKHVFFNEKNNLFLTPEDIKNIIPFDNCISHPGILIKADILKRYKYTDNEQIIHFEDFDLWNRLCSENIKIWNHTDPIMLWRLTPTSITHTYKSDTINRLSNYKEKNICNKFNIQPNQIAILFNKVNDFYHLKLFIKLLIRISSTPNLTQSFKSWAILFLLKIIKGKAMNCFIKILSFTYLFIKLPHGILLIPQFLKHGKRAKFIRY